MTSAIVGQFLSLAYRCLQAHTTQTGWGPPNVAALWAVQG